MKFGDNLKKIRKRNKMSQEELAEVINVSRQSVSKWESGGAYPSINNLMELCKIFNCKLNDLVHKDMSDLTSLDEDIVMKVVKFNDKKQNRVKNLSNVISMVGKIGSIVLMVVIPFLIIAMLLLPYIINNVEIIDDNISFKSDNIKLIDDLNVSINDVIVMGIDGISLRDVKDIFINNTKGEIIFYVEGGLFFVIVNLIIMIIILKYVEKLFNNIKNNSTPFILDNVNLIKRISYLMIALIMINPISEVLFNNLININNVDIGIDFISVLEILIIFSMSYVFEYGYEIQKDSKGKMYS